MKEGDMDTSVQEPKSSTEEVSTKKLTWIIIAGLVIVLFVYFYVVFLVSNPSEDVVLPSGQSTQNSETEIKNEQEDNRPLTNEEITPDTPHEYIKVTGLNTDILNLRVSQEYGRILAHSNGGVALYINKGAECTAECLEKWIPYEASQELSDGELGTVFRGDIDAYQYTWKGEPLYTFGLDNPGNPMQGGGLDGVWEFARP